MDMASQRRLIADQSSLRRHPLPPNFLFSEGLASMPDDLSQLTVLLTGANGTPYSQGLWRLHLKMPEDYPKNPPKATFITRIFHPNVDESTGAVCVETLKRDWDPKLTLKDVLITISCLLIQPNPDSALNSTAGALIQEDYDAFCRQAKLMASIHAPIPAAIKDIVREARLRGEDENTPVSETEKKDRPLSTRAHSSSSSVIMKKKAISNSANQAGSGTASTLPEDDEDEAHDPSKENDPSLSPSPVTPPVLLSPRRSTLGKRPLSDLPTPIELEDDDGMSESQRNISANMTPRSLSREANDAESPLRKSPKLSELSGKMVNASGRGRDETNKDSKSVLPTEDEKENVDKNRSATPRVHPSEGNQGVSRADNVAAKPNSVRPTMRKTSTASSTSSNKSGKARIGIRRL